MSTWKRSRGVAAVAALAAACLTATLVPGQAVAQDRDFIEYPPAPTADSLRETPALGRVADDANNAFKYALATVAANQDPAAYKEGSVEADLAAAFAAASADVRDKAKEASTRLLDSPESRKAEFGRHAAHSPEEFARLGFDGAFTADSALADKDALSAEIQAIANRIEQESRAEDEAHLRYLKYSGIPVSQWSALPQITDLRLRLEKIKVVEETDINAFGSDEIAMGGVRVDNDGTTEKIARFVPPFAFDQGEVFTYAAPGKSYTRFDINPGAYPRKYLVTMIMAEEDDGGFAEMLNAAWAKVKDKVQQVIAQAIAGLTSAFIGAALAEALGQIVAWLVTTFVGWIISLFYDDLFKPVTVAVKLPSKWAYRYDNGVTSGWDNWRTGSHTSTFYQDTGDWSADGIYKANIHWELQTS
jgi:hypothetical protein